MTKPCLAGLALLFLSLTGSIQDEAVTVEKLPPSVVKSSPQAGSVDVDPTVNEIRVTFSKQMTDASWSWGLISKPSFPQVAGKPRYLDDRRTNVLPVTLEPGRDYAIWINSETAKNFKDERGNAAVPYLLVFRTKK